ncbi:Beta-galactosidase C-terminal domain [Nonomuraea jiangxiensis]|uniref:Beta-galactosidase C-terminal domain n=1 Tax=Nonomuraea jiangxiensis TaxID=633440 RepID=UPI001FEC45E2|nr:Beta-galactosidase C-terminal domain [Nonomuraea jiangxiensis]
MRESAEHEYVFLLNHSDELAASVPVTGTDLLTGRQVTEQAELPPLGAAVIRRSRP